MPPVIIQVTVATLAGVLNTIPNLSGGSNGPNVTDFNEKRTNTLPPLPGDYNVGVTPVVFHDYAHHQFPLCDVGNYGNFQDDCLRPRQIIASLFYPSCPPPDNQVKPILLDEEHFAPVFTPTVLGEISRTATTAPDGGLTGLHNLMSRAVTSAPACRGQYPLTVFVPDAGGQRQAYTQVASELASMGHVVLTVDSPFLSGVVEDPSEGVQRSLFGSVVNNYEAFVIQNNDLHFIHKKLAMVNETLSRLSSGINDASAQLDHCIFGHGSGGRIAQMMVDTHVVKCGGRLEGILTLPAPFDGQKATISQPHVINNRPAPSPSSYPGIPQTHSPGFSPFVVELLRVLRDLRGSGLDVLKTLICTLEGTCGTQSRSDSRSIEKRNVADEPWYFPEYPYHKKPCYDDDYGYGDHKDGYGHDCYDDKWYDDCDDHYGYDYDCDDHDWYDYDPSDDYHRPYYPPYYPPQPYPSNPYPPYPPYPYPSRPFPPPGIFPPNMTWPPYGNGQLPYGNTPWDDHWDDYPNSGFPYRPRYGHKDYDHYYGGYPYGYEDFGNDLDCDGYPDHYREWDKKKHCHGWVDHHYDDDDDDCCDHDDDYDDNDCQDYDDDDYDHGDCGEHHHHGNVDDHYDDEGDDYDHDEHDDHGYVDDWDEEDRV